MDARGGVASGSSAGGARLGAAAARRALSTGARRRLLATARDAPARGRSGEAVVAKHFLYLPRFLDEADYGAVKEACSHLVNELRPEHSEYAHNRLGTYVAADSVAHTTLMTEAIGARLSELLGEAVVPADFPVEFRLYPRNAGMRWHMDEMLYAKPQYELVYTVENTSDSTTEWQEGSGIIRSTWTEPNSLLVVRAESVWHRVLPVQRGSRSILKLVYTPTLEKIPNFWENLDTFEGKPER